jgi:peptidoglycan/LPS O-acetylase OafA/YrhL
MRGLAALAVVFYHAHEYLILIGGNPDTYFRLFDAHFGLGAWFFFALSGFLMAYLIDTGCERFLLRRLVRIYPTYWLATSAVIVLKVMIFENVSSPRLFGALTLLPHNSPVGYPLFIEWTLLYEVFFYFVCSAFAVGRMRRRFPAFLTLWALALVVGHSVFGTQTSMMPKPHQLPLSLFNLLFIIGALGYYVFKWVERSTPSVIAACVIAAAASFAGSNYCVAELARFVLLGVGFTAVILLGTIRDRSLGKPGGASRMEKFGDYSYALYLIHVPVITIVLSLARHQYHLACGSAIGTLATGLALLAGWYFGKVDILLNRSLKRKVLGIRLDLTRRSPIPAPLGIKAGKDAVAHE